MVQLTSSGHGKKASAVSSHLFLAANDAFIQPEECIVASGDFAERSVSQVQTGGGNGAKKMAGNGLH